MRGVNGMRLGRYACLALVWLAVLGPQVGARAQSDGSPLELKLRDAIGLALRNNRDLAGRRLERKTQKFALDVAGDRYRPQGSIGSSAEGDNAGNWDPTVEVSPEVGLRIHTGGRFAVRWTKPLSGPDETDGRWSVSFSQPLLKGRGAEVDTAPLRLAELADRSAILSFQGTVAGLVDSTIAAYRRLIQAQRQVEIAEESLQRARRQLELNRAMIEAGQLAAQEIVQTEAGIARRELSLAEARDSLDAARYALIDILDIDGGSRLLPLDGLDPSVVKRVWPDLEQSLLTAFEKRTDYQQGQIQLTTAKINLVAAKNERLWDLSLDADVSAATGGGASTEQRVGVRLKVPLWDRGPELSKRRASDDVRRAEFALLELEQSIEVAVRQAVRGVANGFRRIELARQSRTLAEQKLAIEQEKLRQGLTSTLELTRVEEDLVQAQNGELNAIVSYLGALTALDRTLGATLETWGIEVERVEP